MILLDGKAVADKYKATIRLLAAGLARQPGLAVILVGDNPASAVYVKNKQRDCEECGFKSEEYKFPEDTTTEELLQLIRDLNERCDIDGILLQVPLPPHLNPNFLIDAIAPEKDVDCFHPANIGRLYRGSAMFEPCTPKGIMLLLAYYNVPIQGRRCVVVGRSNTVGRPTAELLTQANGTVTLCHSATIDLAEITRKADILISAVGIPKLINADMVKNGAVVVDVGINRMNNGKLCGDIEYDGVSLKASYITPVPGGVGPMTRTALMQNTLIASTYLQGQTRGSCDG